MEKREIMLNGEKYTLDYKTGTIYKDAVITGDSLLPVNAKVGDYKFIERINSIYFYVNNRNEYYQINQNETEARKITKEIYNNAKNLMKINKNNFATKNLFIEQVILILIEEILKSRYNLQIRFRQFDTRIAKVFKKNFDQGLNNKIKVLSDSILNQMPLYINRNELKKVVTKEFEEIKEQNKEYIKDLENNLFNQTSTRIIAIKDEVSSGLENKKFREPVHINTAKKKVDKVINFRDLELSSIRTREEMVENNETLPEKTENKKI